MTRSKNAYLCLVILVSASVACSSIYAAQDHNLDIEGSGQVIPDGDITPAVADDTEYGSVNVGSPLSHTFTIRNTSLGNTTITIGTVTVSGSSEFTITAQPASPLGRNATTTFTVLFTPTGSGGRTATIAVPTSASGASASKNPYTFDVHGTAVTVTATPPDVDSPPTATAIQDTTATLGGNVAATNNASITERGIYWSTVNGFTPPGQGTKVSSTGNWGTGSFSEAVTGLPESTIVYFKSFALNSAGTNYSSQLDFQTEPTTQASGVTFSGVGANQMQVSWTGSGSGDGVIVIIKQDIAVDVDPPDGTEHTADPGYAIGTDLGSTNYVVFRASGTNVVVTNLLSDTTYHVAVYAYAGAGAGLSGINYQQDSPAAGNQKTLLVTSAPTVASPTETAIQDTTATLGGEVTATNNATITERGIYWSTIDGFTPPGQGTKVSSSGSWGTGTFTEGVTGLTEASLLYYRAFAVNSAGTSYTVQASFRTEPTTQASGVTFSGVGANQMQVSWTGSGSGDGVIVIIKQDVAVDVDPPDGTEHTADPGYAIGTDLGSANYVVFRASGTNVVVTNLLSDTTYHVAVYAYAGSGSGIAGINYQQDSPAAGNQKTLLVTSAPTVANPTETAIQDTTATLGGEVTATNNATITERGIYWSTIDNFTPPGQGTKVSSSGSWGTGTFAAGVTGLTEASLLYYRAFAVNSEGTSYTAQASFQTEPTTQVSGLSISDTNAYGMTISWTGSGSGDGVIVVMKSVSAVSSNPVDGVEHTADSQFGVGTNLGSANYVVFRASGTSVVVTNLTPDTTYHVAAFAYDGSGAGVAGINYQQDGPAVGSGTTLTAPVSITPPTVANTTATAIEHNAATLGGEVTATNGATITERGIYWSTVNGFTPPGQGTKVSSTGTWGTGIFTENVTGLNQGSLIYYKAFALNSAGASYTAQAALQTEPSTQASSPIFTVTNDTSVALQWISGNGDGTLVLIKLDAAPSATPTDGTEHIADPGYNSGGDVLGGDNYVVYRASGNSVTITNLWPNNTYYVSLFEYAGSGTGIAGINYQQEAPASTSCKTLIGLTWMGHNDRYGVSDCLTCHGAGHSGSFIPQGDEQKATTCGQCHNETGVASNKWHVSLHLDSSSNILADCGTCHEVHGGAADLAEMITTRASVTDTNLVYFRVDTNYMPQAIGNGVYHDTTNYVYGAAPYNGPCQVCHTDTSRYLNTGGVDTAHSPVGSDCSSCHAHDDNFEGAGGTDCTTCHAGVQNGHRAVMPDFSLAANHVPGGSMTTNDCLICHHEEFGNAYHGNTTTDLRNVDDDSVVSIAQPFARNTASKNLEADVISLQNNFCLKCHDANGASGDTTPFSTGNPVPDIDTALATTNAYFHPVRGAGSNANCDISSMNEPWNQGAGEHNVISCFDCHGINAHGSANNHMLRVNISGPTDGANIAVFCRTCHDDTATGDYHTKGAHDDPLKTDSGDGPYACRGCHSGQEESDQDNDWNGGITLQSAALDIHGGNYKWPSGTGKFGAGTTSAHFVNGGWLEGWDSAGNCYPDGNCQHATQSY